MPACVKHISVCLNACVWASNKKVNNTTTPSSSSSAATIIYYLKQHQARQFVCQTTNKHTSQPVSQSAGQSTKQPSAFSKNCRRRHHRRTFNNIILTPTLIIHCLYVWVCMQGKNFDTLQKHFHTHAHTYQLTHTPAGKRLQRNNFQHTQACTHTYNLKNTLNNFIINIAQRITKSTTTRIIINVFYFISPPVHLFIALPSYFLFNFLGDYCNFIVIIVIIYNNYDIKRTFESSTLNVIAISPSPTLPSLLSWPSSSSSSPFR